MILKIRMTETSKKNLAIIKAQRFSVSDRVTTGYIIGIAVEETVQLPDKIWETAINDIFYKKEVGTKSSSSSTSVSLRQSVYDQLCYVQKQISKLCGRDVHMSQVIDLVLYIMVKNINSDCTTVVEDSLKVMEWNINARSTYLGYCMPINLIANQVLEKNPKILVLTEFVHTCGWSDLKSILSEKYNIYVSPYQSHRRQNSICIGIRKDSNIKYKGDKTYNFSDGPDLYEVLVSVNGEDIHVIGTRIRIDWKKSHDEDCAIRLVEQEKRAEQFLRLIEHIKHIKNVIVLGDFNNSRILEDENETNIEKIDNIYGDKDSIKYNYQKMCATIIEKTNKKFLLHTAEGNVSSVGARWCKEKRKALHPIENERQRHKYDHVICNSNWEVDVDYKWNFLEFYSDEQFDKGGKIKVGYPDHAILLAEIILSQKSTIN